MLKLKIKNITSSESEKILSLDINIKKSPKLVNAKTLKNWRFSNSKATNQRNFVLVITKFEY